MALDSRQKRAAVIGTARAWYRNPHPSGMDAAQRASVGQVYPVAAFQDAPAVIPHRPSGNKRTIGFSGNNRVSSADSSNRSVSFSRRSTR